MTKPIEAWYFAREDRTLRYGDNRRIVVGKTHSLPVENRDKIKLCNYGLHGSKRIIDALQYAPGPIIYRVELSGVIDIGDDKIAAQERKYVYGFNATNILRDFARRCALDVIHLWDAPDIVIKYLKTGDESLKEAARKATRKATREATREAAWGAARGAVWGAAWGAAREAAWGAAWEAAWEAAWGAAWGAAGRAAREAAVDKQNRRLTSMIIAEQRKRVGERQ